jgi:hypothetical protein
MSVKITNLMTRVELGVRKLSLPYLAQHLWEHTYDPHSIAEFGKVCTLFFLPCIPRCITLSRILVFSCFINKKKKKQKQTQNCIQINVRRPAKFMCNVWPSGVMTSIGGTHVDAVRIGMRYVARRIQLLGLSEDDDDKAIDYKRKFGAHFASDIRFRDFQVTNCTGKGTCGFKVNLAGLAHHYGTGSDPELVDISFEPEFKPFATWKLLQPYKCSLVIYASGEFKMNLKPPSSSASSSAKSSSEESSSSSSSSSSAAVSVASSTASSTASEGSKPELETLLTPVQKLVCELSDWLIPKLKAFAC